MALLGLSMTLRNCVLEKLVGITVDSSCDTLILACMAALRICYMALLNAVFITYFDNLDRLCQCVCMKTAR
jgi:hypothetical protein